jgi:iron complex transport system substrate-binding protein
MLDVGLPKEGLADRLNALQLETNIPYVFIDISFGKLPRAYRTLGSLLGCEARAEALASYVEAAMSEVREIANSKELACKVFYAQRERGPR